MGQDDLQALADAADGGGRPVRRARPRAHRQPQVVYQQPTRPQTVTIQKTSKGLKGAGCLGVLGFVVSLVWLVVVKILTWWRHG